METTVPKAKELRPFVERLITIAKRGLAGGETNGTSLHARRLVLRDIQDRDVVGKLFDTIAPRFEGRPGGYTRILRIGYRRGDSADLAQIELVGSEYNPNAEVEKTEAAKKAQPKGVGGRLRAAAERLRGRRPRAPRKNTDKTGTRPSRSASSRVRRAAGHDERQGLCAPRTTERQAGHRVSTPVSSGQ